MRRACAWLAIAALAPAAYAVRAAEPELTIELPAIEVSVSRVSPPYFQKEGLPYNTENELVTEILTRVGAEDYEGALTAAKKKHAAELQLLEAGDPGGVVAGRAGPGRLPIPVPAGGDEISATVLYLVGVAYMELERYVPAEAALKAALVPLPDYLRVHEALGLMYSRMERFADARAHFTRAAELGLNTAGLYATLGYLNSATKNYWGAVSAYQQALTMDPDNRSVQSSLLHALNETHQYAAGLALVEQMLQDDPNDPRLWLYRAQLSLSADRRDAALTSLETAIRLGDDSVANKQVCATLHMERGSVARAVELLKSLPPEALDFQFLDQALAWLAYENRWEYLRDLLAAAVERRSSLTEPQRSHLLTRRAALELNDGDRQAARATLQEAVGLDATNAEALMVLGQAYLDDRDYNRAETTFQRASAFPEYADNARVSLAQLAIDQQDFERALALLRDVLSRNPARTDLQRNVDTLESLVQERARN
ncbi:MAG TPA: tetratricopeptide repeat protein [Gammaproteobacteria bacterium]|nr:tetratricopeptide repeat protein [Gammaproteobacteria bacterium]